MDCTFCRAPLPEGAQKCPRCGAPVLGAAAQPPPGAPVYEPPAAQAAQTQPTVRCTACGAALPAGTAFCPRCGTALGGPSPQERAREERKAEEFWAGVDAKAKQDAKERRSGNIISWIVRLIGLAVLAYVVWQIVS